MQYWSNTISQYINICLVAVVIMVSAVSFVLPLEEVDESLHMAPRNVICYENVLIRSNEGKVYHDNIPFTGVVNRFDDSGQLRSARNYIDGKLNGLTQRWYANGQLLEIAQYKSNKLHGTKSTYYRNGQLRSESHLIDGKINGVAIDYYDTGTLFRRRYFKQGKAAGMQQAWRPNGALYTNVDVRNGRSFGLNRAELCFELNDNEAMKIYLQ